MRYPIPLLAVPLLALGLPMATAAPTASATSPETAAELRSFIRALADLAPDAALGGVVSDFTITRDGATFHLADGYVWPLTMDGRIVGAVFAGDGTLAFEPAGSVEKAQLARHLGDRSIERSMSRVVFLFTDGTWDEIRPVLGDPSTGGGDVGGWVSEAMGYLVDGDRSVADPVLLSSFLDAGRPPLFHAHMDMEDGPDLYYRLDQGAEEAVELGRDGPGRTYDLISSFAAGPRTEAADEVPVGGGGGGGTPYRAAEVVGYGLDVTIEENLDFSAEARLFAFANAGPGSWVSFTLAPALGIRAVEWEGQPVPFMRGEESARVWVRAPDSVTPGAPANLVFRYAGDIISRQRDWYILEATTGWYPTIGRTDATFDMRFTTHRKHRIMAAGFLESTGLEGDRVTTHWVVNEPAPHTSFNVGDFDERSFDDPRVPPVTLHYSERAHRDLGLITQKDMGQAVGSDLVNSIAFFQEAFGPTGATAYNATEIPSFHGQAFPGMVQLSFVTFQWTGESGAAEIFRAHEIAHQWWGIGITPRTYHDAWLSEGLAEFSGLWYMQRVLMSSPKYLGHLEDARDNILRRRGKAGPIWLGPRLVTSETEEDYQIIVYEKGAWVVHMLRYLMRDYETMSDDRFLGMLEDFFQANRGRSVTTEDFLAAVETHTGAEMDWFFDQWVYGTDVPRYEWAVEGEDLPSGEHRMRLRVEQSMVPDDFKMVVPVRLDFGADGYAYVRVLVEGPRTETELGVVPREPDNVVFNAEHAVLAEVSRERW